MPIYVNSVEIEDKDVFQEMQYHSAPTQEAALDEAAKALLIRELLRQQAVEKELLAKDASKEEIDAAVMDLVKTEVATPEADEEACRRYYEQNIDRFVASDDPSITLSYEAVEDTILDYLHTRSIRNGIQFYILDLARQARIVGFDLAATL